MSKQIIKQKPERNEEVQEWIDEEAAKQRERHKKIAYEMNVELADQREHWYREFEQRIQTTGTNIHADIKKIVEPEDIYEKPDREHKVVY